jgi:phosphate transport system ATP-binding protein
MDEPCSALDPIATARIEELIDELRGAMPSSSSPTRCSRPPASRSAPPSSTSARWWNTAKTSDIFTNPREERTKDYITGRYG